MRKSIIGLAAVAILALAACGGGNPATSPTTTPAARAPSSAAASPNSGLAIGTTARVTDDAGNAGDVTVSSLTEHSEFNDPLDGVVHPAHGQFLAVKVTYKGIAGSWDYNSIYFAAKGADNSLYQLGDGNADKAIGLVDNSAKGYGTLSAGQTDRDEFVLDAPAAGTIIYAPLEKTAAIWQYPSGGSTTQRPSPSATSPVPVPSQTTEPAPTTPASPPASVSPAPATTAPADPTLTQLEAWLRSDTRNGTITSVNCSLATPGHYHCTVVYDSGITVDGTYTQNADGSFTGKTTVTMG
jgi:hypothetical protein